MKTTDIKLTPYLIDLISTVINIEGIQLYLAGCPILIEGIHFINRRTIDDSTMAKLRDLRKLWHCVSTGDKAYSVGSIVYNPIGDILSTEVYAMGSIFFNEDIAKLVAAMLHENTMTGKPQEYHASRLN